MATLYQEPKDELNKLYEKARATSCWFYNTQSGSWMTPEEYKNTVEGMLLTGTAETTRVMFHTYCLANPLSGVLGRMKSMTKATEDLREFTQRVKDYYDLTPKPDDSKYM